LVSGQLTCKCRKRASTLFWMDRWVGDVPLCDMFSRLYDFSDNELTIVAQMFGWGWEV